MDRVRVFETGEGVNTVQAELFPDISIGDAPAPTLRSGAAAARVRLRRESGGRRRDPGGAHP